MSESYVFFYARYQLSDTLPVRVELHRSYCLLLFCFPSFKDLYTVLLPLRKQPHHPSIMPASCYTHRTRTSCVAPFAGTFFYHLRTTQPLFSNPPHFVWECKGSNLFLFSKFYFNFFEKFFRSLREGLRGRGRGLSLLLYSPAQDGKHIKCFPLRAELATNLTPAPSAGDPPCRHIIQPVLRACAAARLARVLPGGVGLIVLVGLLTLAQRKTGDALCIPRFCCG